jgi:colicin import membrane protein
VLEFARQHAIPLLLAGVLHVALFAGLLIGLPQSQRDAPEPAARPPVQATAVSESDLRTVEQRRANERAAEQRRQQEAERQRQLEAQRVAEAERQRQAEAQRQREAQEAEQRARVEAERRAVAEKQAQERRAAEDARRAEEARKAEAARKAEEARKAAEAEARARAEAETRRKAEEAARAQAQREAAAQAERQRQLAAQIDAEQRLMELQGSSEYQLWLGDIQSAVIRNWNRPPSARAGLDCQVRVSLIPGMQVVNAEIVRCNGDDAVRRSIIAAVERASPLPRPPDPSLFERTILFDFKPKD